MFDKIYHLTIAYMLNEGHSVGGIAHHLGVDKSSIYRHIKAHNMTFDPKKGPQIQAFLNLAQAIVR